MATPARFYAESFAPWCERARWALDHHQVSYREIEQRPMIAELTLRAALRGQARRPRRVTVPLLVHGDAALMASDEIARHAERCGRGAPLFPAAHEEELRVWMQRSEALMVAGRAMLLPRIAASPEALREHLPPSVPRILRRALQWVVALGVAHLVRKYDVRIGDGAYELECRGVLDALRAALADGRRHLVGDAFSYADITMAAALQFVLPVDDRYISLAPATRRAWTHARLAADYADLLAWRDALYVAHRR
jgi:glutathione S-transferase